jgi:CRISPR type III-B/RAMP module-associated protein Cmr5
MAGASEDSKKYRSLCKKAGGLLRTSGLMQMVAFMEARGQRTGEHQHLTLLEHLQSELRSLNLVQTQTGEGLWLAQYIRGLNLPEYMALTRKVLLLLTWHRRLAETLIQGEAVDNQMKGV